MTVAEKHIWRFNLMNGNLIRKETLLQFLSEVQSVKSPDLRQLESKLKKAISMMNGKPVVVDFTPLKYPSAKPVKSVIAKPAVKKPPVKKRVVKKKIVKTKPKKRAGLDGLHSRKRSEPKPDPAQAGFTTDKKISGLRGFEDVGKMKFKEIYLDGDFKELIGERIFGDTQLMFWGKPGSGKTVLLLKLAQYLAEKGLNVLYVANEEMDRSTLTEKVNQFKIGHPNLKATKNLVSDIEPFDVIFFDSVNSMGMDLKSYVKYTEDHPGKIYIPIVQCTKDGEFKGGKDWEHAVDVCGEVVKRKIVYSKNRLDPNQVEKQEEFMIEEMINHKKKQKMINDHVRNRMQHQDPIEVIENTL